MNYEWELSNAGNYYLVKDGEDVGVIWMMRGTFAWQTGHQQDGTTKYGKADDLEQAKSQLIEAVEKP